MSGQHRSITQWFFAVYYAGTVMFAVLDFFFAFNIRLSFLDPWPGWRALYYVLCFGCFLMIWRHPAWSNVIAAAESLINVSALIISMAVRVMVVTDAMIDEGHEAVAFREILNFLIAGSAAYLALVMRSCAAHSDLTGGSAAP